MKMNLNYENYKGKEPIAVIGIGCRFPGGADNPLKFWQLLLQGVDAITEIPEDRWSVENYYDPNRAKSGRTNTRWGGFLKKIDEFDAQFFGISPREASTMDPQQRLLLEVCYEAFEDGGQVVEKLAGSKTGVFIGGFTLDWKLLQFSRENRYLIDSHSATGSMMTLLANRISYAFDLKGPSMALDTACSSSLVAVHLACQSIWNNESQMALAGGVNIMILPEYFIAESRAGMLSEDGHSKTYDSSANGYARGEGSGIVLLKPLSQAIKDNDVIHAIIRGTGCNQDGHTSGITVPNGDAQSTLMRYVYNEAGILPAEIQYVEAHGTGTPIGDPIEAKAIGTVMSQGRGDGDKCIIGSVKTNIGHLEASAGAAGLIKTILSVEYGLIPKHIHLKKPNTAINFDMYHLEVPSENMPWPRTDGPRRAGVNSFGFGGTNAHVIIEQYVEPAAEEITNNNETNQTKAFLLPFSAKSDKSLKAFTQAIMEMNSEKPVLLDDLGFSLSQKRDHYDHRLALVAKNNKELDEQIQSFISDEICPGLLKGTITQPKKPLAFVFTGMGPQWWAMGQQLIQDEPVFREAVEKVDEQFRKISGWSILQEMLTSEETSRIEETEVAQPANFALQIGLAALWKSWGIIPDAIIGHSAGEVAASYVSGAISFEDAVQIIYSRSHFQQMTTGLGKMAAVGLTYEEALNVISDYKGLISIAAINSQNSITMSGDSDALQCVVAHLEEAGVFCKYLHVKVPYHSHYMEQIKSGFINSLRGISPKQTTTPLYSTVTGKPVNGCEMDSSYWWKNIREPVHFSDACTEIIRSNYGTFIEIGPHPVLANSIRECLQAAGKQGTVLKSLRRGEHEQSLMLSTLGELYTLGYSIAWGKLYPAGRTFVKYPLYPWNRERYWQESASSQLNRLGKNKHPLLGNRIDSPAPVWENDLNTYNVPYLEDHKIQNTVTFPGAGYVEMSLAAIRELYGETATIYGQDIQFRKALFLPEDKIMKIRLTYDKKDALFNICSKSVNSDSTEWTLNSKGKVFPTNKKVLETEPIDEFKKRCTNHIPREQCYNRFKNIGLVYGNTFQGIHDLWQGTDEAFANVDICDELDADITKYSIHPAVLDICFQVLAAAIPFTEEKENAKVYMPTEVHSALLADTLKKHMCIYAKITQMNDRFLRGDIVLMDDSGHVILKIEDCKAVSLKSETQSYNREQILYEMKWTGRKRCDASKSAAVNRKEHGVWLAFADKKGIANAFANDLREQEVRVLTVGYGEKYEFSDSAITINRKSPEHYKKMLSDISENIGQECEGIVHFWSLDIAETKDLTCSLLEQAEELGTNSALFLVQALAQHKWENTPRIWFVTQGSQQISDGTGEINIAQSSLWGMGRVIGHQEHMQMFGGMIDLDRQLTQTQHKIIFQEIWNNDGEDHVAYRGDERYTARLVLSENLDKPIPATFRPDASYMITGGFGALGLLVAQWMIERGARHLILMGRSDLPPRSEWSSVRPGSSIAKKITAVHELEALGASVHVAAVDVTNELELSNYLNMYNNEGWPEIKGVIHSAGVAVPQLLLQMNVTEFNSVLRTKVMGSWNLHKYFENKALDFFVLFSSIASLVVLGGQGNYSAGNTFMDALAHYRNNIGKPAVSINWGPWAEVGMATQLDLLTYFIKKGLFPMTPEQGMAAFEYLIGQSTPQVAVLGAHWPTVADKSYPMGIYPPLISELLENKPEIEEASNKVDPLDGKLFMDKFQVLNSESERLALIQAHLSDLISLVLRVNRSQISVDQSLTSWGLDSMMAIELKNSIEKSMKVTIAVVDLLKGPTIDLLANHLAEKIMLNISLSENQDTAELVEEIDELSFDEVEDLIAAISENK